MSSDISTPERIRERRCKSCAYKIFEIDQDPCMTCDRTATKEIPCPRWVLDPNCCNDEGGSAPTSSGMLPVQQKIGHLTAEEAKQQASAYIETVYPNLSAVHLEHLNKINLEMQKIIGAYSYRHITYSEYLQRTDKLEADLQEIANTAHGTIIEIDYEGCQPIKVNGESVQTIIDRQRKSNESSISTTICPSSLKR